MSARLIGLDWGTSSFRAWLMGQGGAVLEQIASDAGILNLRDRGFEAAFDSALGPWFAQAADVAVIASGMITSRNGWVETPYLPLPLDAGALAAALTAHRTAAGRAVHFVPGARCETDGMPDLMRGEETELVGHLEQSGSDGVVVLPGTHSKWARAQGGRLTGFRSCMTGEVFALLHDHSILGRLAEPGPFDDGAFRRGLGVSGRDGPLLARIFSARSLVLMGGLAPGQVADYLSGILIGDEIRTMGRTGHGAVTIIGRGDLAERYRLALEQSGRAAQVAAPGMARIGLWNIAKRAGVVG